MLFPLPCHEPKRNSGRRMDPALLPAGQSAADRPPHALRNATLGATIAVAVARDRSPGIKDNYSVGNFCEIIEVDFIASEGVAGSLLSDPVVPAGIIFEWSRPLSTAQQPRTKDSISMRCF